MSWQWIPAQLEIRGATPNSQPGNYYAGYKPGYYIGKGRDEGKYLVNAYGYSGFGYGPTDKDAWIIVSDVCPRFAVSAYTSSDALADSFHFVWGNGNRGNSQSSREEREQEIYFGKPKYVSDSSSFCLKYSPTEGRYIIVERGLNHANDYLEPIYSTNVLSGGLSGDYYWKADAAVTDLQIDTPTITFSLTGATTDYMASEDYIDHFTISSDMDFYSYNVSCATSADDERPAGLYTNKNGDEIEVGIRTYKSDDGAIWRAHDLCSNPHYDSFEHGRLAFTLSTEDWGDCWVTSTRAEEPKYVYQSSLSSLPDTFVLEYYEYDSEASAYVAVPSCDLTMVKGPYQLLSVANSITMGEYSQWR